LGLVLMTIRVCRREERGGKRRERRKKDKCTRFNPTDNGFAERPVVKLPPRWEVGDGIGLDWIIDGIDDKQRVVRATQCFGAGHVTAFRDKTNTHHVMSIGMAPPAMYY